MIGFTSGNMTILPQTLKVKGVEIEVPCKACRWTPIENKETGKLVFCRSPWWSYQVHLGDVRRSGPPIKVKLTIFTEPIKEGDETVGYHPDRITGLKVCFPPMTTSAARPSIFDQPTKIFKDSTKPKRSDPKDREASFPSLDNGLDYLIGRYGEAMAEMVMSLLLDEFHANEKAA